MKSVRRAQQLSRHNKQLKRASSVSKPTQLRCSPKLRLAPTKSLLGNWTMVDVINPSKFGSVNTVKALSNKLRLKASSFRSSSSTVNNMIRGVIPLLSLSKSAFERMFWFLVMAILIEGM
eukprot:TRINITY_DN208_c0_g1_i1.p1 TRINITY_DN208_c0_g1~~TRINITY_DN208_c0_g1_i1.p1  ORF type:complete len:120 (+),score=17.37 TRINITY_DN208_c0_g1_i1:269-628(+)